MTIRAIKERYLVDEKGNRLGVFLEMDDYPGSLRRWKSWNPSVRMMPPRRQATKLFSSPKRLRRSSATGRELRRQHSPTGRERAGCAPHRFL
jgi:hypothetical protein